MLGCSGECTTPEGKTVTLGGTTTEADVGLVFTSDNPLGVELDAGGNVTTPLSRVRIFNGCIGDGRPGRRVMVTGHVLARTRPLTVNGRVLPLLPSDNDPLVVSSLPRVKLAVTSCGQQGRVIVDVDSLVVVDQGEMSIELLMPATWQLMGERTLTDDETWTDATVVVRACPIDFAWAPDGVLTEWFPLDAETPTNTPVLIRPRRARTLAAQAVAAVGPPFAPAAINVSWRNVVGIAGPALGATTFGPATQQTIEPFGSAVFLQVTPSATGMANLRWGIR